MSTLTEEKAVFILMQCEPETGLLEVAERWLRDNDKTALAESLSRLVIDIGLEQHLSFEPDPAKRPAPPGEHTARLCKNYTPVTLERARHVLHAVLHALPQDQEIGTRYKAFFDRLEFPLPALGSAAAYPPPKP